MPNFSQYMRDVHRTQICSVGKNISVHVQIRYQDFAPQFLSVIQMKYRRRADGTVDLENAVVRRIIVVYRHYANSNGHLRFDEQSLRVELHHLRYDCGWPMAARVLFLRVHKAIQRLKRRRIEEEIGKCSNEI